MSIRTKTSPSGIETKLDVPVMKACMLLETLLETLLKPIVGAQGDSNGIVHNLGERLPLFLRRNVLRR